MYNRYIPNGASYTRIPEEDGPSAHGSAESPGPAPRQTEEPVRAHTSAALAKLLDHLKLTGLDTGDILLLLILLFLFLEGDDLEIVITLGLLLLLGLE
ncbi:hypothetical protein [Flavonifractor hominis]|uniref:Uncharacterized protein n=1 Tax=Flavonifractor hominis TaxID=3133178 RepID=A0ABV1EPM3_9FIRM